AAGPGPGGGVLAVQQRCAVPLPRDPGPGGLPLLLRGVQQVALDLPAQRRIGVQEQGDHADGSHRLLRGHRGKGPKRDQAKNTDRTASTIDGNVAGTPSPRRVCTSAAKTIVIARPAPASGTSTVATPVSAGRSRPIAPRISSTPIPRITDCGKSSTQGVRTICWSRAVTSLTTPLPAKTAASTKARIHINRSIGAPPRTGPPHYPLACGPCHGTSRPGAQSRALTRRSWPLSS